MKIRKMQKSDVPEVAAIENAIFSVPWSERSIEEAMLNHDNIYLVCTIDDKVAGYIGVWGVLGEGNITNVAVLPQYRRMGVAKALLNTMETEGEKLSVNTFFLEVRKSNVAAISLYESVGYEKIGKRNNFYEKPVEDAFVMSKML